MVVREVIAIVVLLFTFGFLNMFVHLITSEIVQGYNESGQMTAQMATTGGQFVSGLEMYDLIIVIMMVVVLRSSLKKGSISSSLFYHNVCDGCFLRIHLILL